MVFFTFTYCGNYVDLLFVFLVLKFKFQLKIENKTETDQSEILI